MFYLPSAQQDTHKRNAFSSLSLKIETSDFISTLYLIVEYQLKFIFENWSETLKQLEIEILLSFPAF